MSGQLPNGGQAVMPAHSPAEVEVDDPQTALFRALEYFGTPPWGGRAGAEILRLLDPKARTIWEPACGEGSMAGPIAESFDVFASDIHPFGYGAVVDFLHDGGGWASALSAVAEHDWIMTNPPFKAVNQFLRLGLRRARRGVALLLPLRYLEGIGRYRPLFGAEPLTRFAVFSERLPLTLGRWDPAAKTATGYAWFFWMKGASPMPPIGIPPGTRDRLWRPDDAALYGRPIDAPLLDAMSAR